MSSTSNPQISARSNRSNAKTTTDSRKKPSKSTTNTHNKCIMHYLPSDGKHKRCLKKDFLDNSSKSSKAKRKAERSSSNNQNVSSDSKQGEEKKVNRPNSLSYVQFKVENVETNELQNSQKFKRVVLCDQSNTIPTCSTDQQVINIQTPEKNHLSYPLMLQRDLQPTFQPQICNNSSMLASRHYRGYQSQPQTIVNKHQVHIPNANSYSPVTYKNNSLGVNGNSPTKIVYQNICSQGTVQSSILNENYQLPQKWNIILTKLELFQRERLIKLRDSLVQIQSQASDDEIVKTMLENVETRAFADQRIEELMREGLCVEQEIQIEQLSKQLLVGQSEASKNKYDSDHYAKDIQRYSNENKKLKREYEQMQQKLVKAVNEVKEKYKHKLEQEKQKHIQLQDQLETKQSECIKLDERVKILERQIDTYLSGLKSDMKALDVQQQLQNYQQTIKDLEQKLLTSHNSYKVLAEQFSLQKQNSTNDIKDYQEQMKINEEDHLNKLDQIKQKQKDKYLQKLQQMKERMEEAFSVKLTDIQNEIKSKIEDARKEEANKVNEKYILISQHEIIVNFEIEKLKQSHDAELGAIKQAFEKELRKAEKKVKSQSVKDLEQVKLDKESVELQLSQGIKTKEEQIEGLKVQIQDTEAFYQQEISKLQEQYKNIVRELENELERMRKANDHLKVECSRFSMDNNQKLTSYEKERASLLKELEQNSDKIKQLQHELKSKDYEIEEREYKLERLEHQHQDLNGKYELCVQKRDHFEEQIQIYEQNISAQQRLNNDNMKEMVWKLGREQDRVTRMKQELMTMRKLVRSDLEFCFRDFSGIVNGLRDKCRRKLESESQVKYKLSALEYQRLETQLSDYKSEIEQLQIKLDDLRNSKQQLECESQARFKKQIELENDRAERDHQKIIELNEQVYNLMSDNQKLAQCQKELSQQLDEKVRSIQEQSIQLQHSQKQIQETEQELFCLKNNLTEFSLIDEEPEIKFKDDILSKHEDLFYRLREKYQKSQQDVQQALESRLNKKLEKLKAKHAEQLEKQRQDFLSEQIKREEEAASKFNSELADISEQYVNKINELERELLNLNSEYKKLKDKHKKQVQQLLKERQQNQRIEQEVSKSLAKVDNHKKCRHNHKQLDRSYQSLPGPSQLIPNGYRTNESYKAVNMSLNHSYMFPKSTKNLPYISDVDASPKYQSSANCEGRRKVSPISHGNDNSYVLNNNSSFCVNNYQRKLILNQNSAQDEKNGNSPYNKLKDSSINRVFNISQDYIVPNGGNNESFLLARSLSPRQRTGMFGNQVLLGSGYSKM